MNKKTLGIICLRWSVGRKIAQLGVNASFEYPIFVQGGENISIGGKCQFSRFVQLNSESGKIRIGDFFSIGVNSQIDAEGGGDIQIGNSVLIGSNVVLRASNHQYKAEISIREQGHLPGTISIGDDVWIGSNSVILPGVCIESHSVIGAGSVVTKNVAAYTVVAGNPAREIKIRS